MSVSARLGFTTQLARKASGTTRCFTGLRQVTHRRLLQQAHQKSGSFPPPALPSFIGTYDPVRLPLEPMSYGTVEAATLAQHGPPRLRDPLSRRAVPITPVDRSRCVCRLLPQIVLPSPNSGRVGVHNFPFEACSGFICITARRVARPPEADPAPRRGRLLSQGFDPADCSTEPPASYRANRPLPGWDLHPQGDRPLRGAPELRREGKQRFARALQQRRETRQRSANKNLLRESPCALREILCRKLTTLSGRDRWVSVFRQRITISTRRFCGSRTPGPVCTSRLRIAKTLDGDGALRHAVLDQLGLHRPGAADREALVVLMRARGVGVAVHLDARVLDAGGIVGRLLDDLARPIGERCLVPVEEHQIGARGRGRRRGLRSGGTGTGGATLKA